MGNKTDALSSFNPLMVPSHAAKDGLLTAQNALTNTPSWLTGATDYTFGKRALKLLQSGFEPIPIRRQQKAPAISGWTEVDIGIRQVADWNIRYADCGIGLRLGKSVQDGAVLGAIDVDCQSEAVAQGLVDWFKTWGENYGFTVPIRIGKAPKFLVACCIEGIGGKSFSSEWTDGNLKNRIEILTTGNQFVAYGIHPDTGQPYTWHHATPEVLGAAGLPLITLEQIGASLFPTFEQLCREHGLRETGKKANLKPDPALLAPDFSGTTACSPDTAGAQAPDQQAPPQGAPVQGATVQGAPPRASIDELRAVVGLLPASYCEGYGTWMEVCLALHYETQGSMAGRDLFDEWSRGSAKYPGKDETEGKWQSVHDTASRKLTVGTLYSWLEDSGVELPDSLRRMRQARLEGADKPPLLVDTMREAAEEQRLRDEFEGLVEDVADVADVADVGPCRAGDKEMSPNLSPTDRAVYGSVTTQIWDYIQECEGEFSNSLIYQDFSLKTAAARKTVRKVLERLCKAGKIEKIPGKTGVYRRCVTEIDWVNLDEAEETPFPMPLPFNLSSQIKVPCGSVVLVSGTTNAGKTTFAFQCVEAFLREIATSFRGTAERERAFALSCESSQRANPQAPLQELARMDKPVRYLNCELSPGQIMARIKAMGPESAELLKTRVGWANRTHDWARAIDPDALNVVDYLQIYDEFYRVGQLISEIHARLRNGVALVLIQKKTGEATPRGGEFALERAQVAIYLDSNPAIGSGGGICTLRKVKEPVDPSHNPQGKQLDYRLGANMRLEAISKLRFVDKKERAQADKRYEEERKLEELERERQFYEG